MNYLQVQNCLSLDLKGCSNEKEGISQGHAQFELCTQGQTTKLGCPWSVRFQLSKADKACLHVA